MKYLIASLVILSVLAGCGGSGGPESPAPHVFTAVGADKAGEYARKYPFVVVVECGRGSGACFGRTTVAVAATDVAGFYTSAELYSFAEERAILAQDPKCNIKFAQQGYGCQQIDPPLQ